jgi:hypothetical protein
MSSINNSSAVLKTHSCRRQGRQTQKRFSRLFKVVWIGKRDIVTRRGSPASHRRAPAVLAGACCCSVFVGQEQCRDQSVRLSNDPYCPSLAHAIAAQQSEALFKTQFVFSLVVLSEIAPITAKLA